MTYTETRKDLVINKMTQAKYDELLASNQISDTELYFIIDDNDKFYLKDEVYTKEEVLSLVDGKIESIINGAPEVYNTFKEIADYIESDLTSAAAMTASINNKANKAEVYTIAEADAKFALKTDTPDVDLSDYYTKDETLEAIDKISGLDNYYDKDETDVLLLNLDIEKQDTLVSGTNIKTINGEDILGTGNIEVAASGGGNVIANPSLDGGEEILESVQIEDVKYSLKGNPMTFSENVSNDTEAKVLKTIIIEDDEWKVEKGSIVSPNVELTGSEDYLQSIEIDGNIYTVKGEELVFSETSVDGATPLKNIKIGEDNWSIIGGSGGSADLTGYATEEYVNTKVADLVNSAPETLNTLGELATALQENESVVETLNSAITNKQDKITYSETLPEDTTNLKDGDIVLVPNIGSSSGESGGSKITVLEASAKASLPATLVSSGNKYATLPTLTIENYSNYTDYKTRFTIILHEGSSGRSRSFSFIKTPYTFFQKIRIDYSYNVDDEYSVSSTGVVNVKMVSSNQQAQSNSGIEKIIIEEF